MTTATEKMQVKDARPGTLIRAEGEVVRYRYAPSPYSMRCEPAWIILSNIHLGYRADGTVIEIDGREPCEEIAEESPEGKAFSRAADQAYRQ